MMASKLEDKKARDEGRSFADRLINKSRNLGTPVVTGEM